MENENNFFNLENDDLIEKTAVEKFGIKYLFPWQRLVIANILEANEYFKYEQKLSEEERKLFEEDNSDSFCLGKQIVLLPTGAGKSMCFQVPALFFDGPTLVIYPLLALMSDQERRMNDAGLECVVLKGGQSESERAEVFTKIKNGAKIILANPEVLTSQYLLNRLKIVNIKHIAIDEAHCVSEWGKSFRPSYLQLDNVIKTINPPVITAFTATASTQVLENISDILFNGEAHVVRSESDRPNIHYFVRYASAKKKEILLLANKELKPMIIFCGTRRKAEDMAQELNVCFGKGTSLFYHAGLERQEKKNVEEWFYQSKNGILCATCAYGMGVDKKDIRTVIHLEPPQTAEAYIQEAGRGGRDGSIAKAILLWSLEDSLVFNKYKKDSRQYYIKEFAETENCRRQVLLDALAGEQAVCSGCDNCINKEKDRQLEKLRGVKKIKYLNDLKKEKYVADWKMTYSIIKKSKNYYSEQDIENKIFTDMNKRYNHYLGKNIWTHKDSEEVLTQLKECGKIQFSGFLWKDRLKSKKEN